MNKKPIGVMIAGAGAIAAVHADAYLQFEDRCSIVAVCDVFEDKAKELVAAKGLRAKTFSDYREALKLPEVDAVSICLPPSLHAEVAVAALSSGKHVLCEKPMAGSLEECDAMVKAADISGKTLSVVAQNRFKTPNQKVQRLLRDKTAGEVLLAVVNSLWWRGENYYDLSWRGTWEKEGGGCVLNHAVHHIDLLLWMMGKPVRVEAAIGNVGHDNSQCEDFAAAVFFYPGAVAQLNANLLTHDEEQELVFQCKKARLSVPWKPFASKALENGFPKIDDETRIAMDEAYQALPSLKTEGHPAQIANFLAAIAGEENLLIDGRQGRDTIELITAIYKSACTKSAVTLPLASDDAFYKKGGLAKLMPHFHEKTRSVDNLKMSEPISLGRDVGK